jgi:hypothetical protein
VHTEGEHRVVALAKDLAVAETFRQNCPSGAESDSVCAVDSVFQDFRSSSVSVPIEDRSLTWT